MNPLKNLETMLANLLEGTFGRVFRSEVRPMELARRLAREMDAHRTQSVSRVYVPNEYTVWLSPQDRESYEDVEEELIGELCGYLLEHARRESLTLTDPPRIAFQTDERLTLGEFGIETRIAREEHDEEPPGDVEHQADALPGERSPSQEWLDPSQSFAGSPAPASAGPSASAGSPAPASAGPSASAGPPAPVSAGSPAPASPRARPRPPEPPAPAPQGSGETLIYSSSQRVGAPVAQARAARTQRAVLVVDGRRVLLPPPGAVIGRSRECDVVLDDSGVSRRHAEIRPTADGWTVRDLGSTNGVRLNGRRLRGTAPLQLGDRLELGSTDVVFEVR